MTIQRSNIIARDILLLLFFLSHSDKITLVVKATGGAPAALATASASANLAHNLTDVPVFHGVMARG